LGRELLKKRPYAREYMALGPNSHPKQSAKGKNADAGLRQQLKYSLNLKACQVIQFNSKDPVK